MTARQRGIATIAEIIHELADLVRRQPLVPAVVVDHQHRRAIAGAETLDFRQREHAVGRRLSGPDPQLRAQLLGHPLGAEQRALLKRAADRWQLSARSSLRVLKVARTIADLEQSAAVTTAHVAEALQLRCRERT